MAELRAVVEAEAEARGAATAEREATRLRLAQETQMEQAMRTIGAIQAELAAPLAQKERALADLVVDLGFRLARHLLLQEVSLSQASVQAVVERVLQQAVHERTHEQSIVVHAHPSDEAALAHLCQADRITLLADEAVQRGGARIELVTTDGDPINKVEWDAEIGSRLEELRQALSGAAAEPSAEGAGSGRHGQAAAAGELAA
ncbi:FliH/SctL family protein [Acidisoma sp. C75]